MIQNQIQMAEEANMQSQLKPVLYLLPGLGADHHLFGKFHLEGFQLKCLEYPQPLLDENIQDYASRLAQQIPKEGATLLGVSIGGILSIEIAKHTPIKKIILISSIKTKTEKPIYFQWMASLKLYRLFKASTLKKAGWLSGIAFGLHDAASRKAFSSMLGDTDDALINWGIQQIACWDPTPLPRSTPIIHIHGTHDLIFPHPFIKPDYSIKKGAHFMIFDKGEELSQLVQRLLKDQASSISKS